MDNETLSTVTLNQIKAALNSTPPKIMAEDAEASGLRNVIGSSTAGVVGVSLKAPAIAKTLGAPIVLAASGTYSQSGTLVTVTTSGHGHTASKNGGTVYLTVSSGAAATGWYSNFLYVDANTYKVTSLLSLSTSGNLSGTTSEIQITSTVTPGGSCGTNGKLEFTALISNTNSANNKNIIVRLAGTAIFQPPAQTTNLSAGYRFDLWNRGSQSSQITSQAGAGSSGNPWGANTNSLSNYNFNMNQDQVLTIGLQVANTADSITLEALSLELLPSA